MVAIKYLGVALLVLIGASAFTQATFINSGAGVEFSLLYTLCDGWLGAAGVTFVSLFDLFGAVLGGFVSILVNVFGGLLGILTGGGYNGAQFFGFEQAPSDVGTFLGGEPTSNGAFLELLVKLFFTTAPFFNKGCGHDVGSIFAQGVYASSVIVVTSDEDYYNGCTYLKRVKTSDYSELYGRLNVEAVISKWDAAIEAEGGDITTMSGPKRLVFTYGNYLFNALRNKSLYGSSLLLGYFRAVWGLIGFGARVILGSADAVLQLFANILGGISIGAGVQGNFGVWSDDVSNSCNQYLDGVTKENFISGTY